MAMFLPISRFVEARSELHDATKSHEYTPHHLRGESGDYAIVEGEAKRAFGQTAERSGLPFVFSP